MKMNFLKVAACAFALAVCAILPSCGNNKPAEAEKAAEVPAAKAETLPNYRYVDLDSVLSKYNLAKDYNEEMLRMQTNMESEMKRHQTSLQSFGTSIQNKLQNNGYLSEESFKADQQKYNNMEVTAQKAMNTLQGNLATAQYNAQKAVNDSIEAFINDYNANKGYDAILFKAATLYINPALDITAEVVEGLNARYNKVKK